MIVMKCNATSQAGSTLSNYSGVWDLKRTKKKSKFHQIIFETHQTDLKTPFPTRVVKLGYWYQYVILTRNFGSFKFFPISNDEFYTQGWAVTVCGPWLLDKDGQGRAWSSTESVQSKNYF